MVGGYRIFPKFRQHLNSLKGIETHIFFSFMVWVKGRQHLNSLKGIETSSALKDIDSSTTRQHLNSLKGIETQAEVYELARPYTDRQHLNSLKGIETGRTSGWAFRKWKEPTTLEFPERDWNQEQIPVKIPVPSDNTWIPWKGLKRNLWLWYCLCRACRQHLNSLKGIETCIYRIWMV